MKVKVCDLKEGQRVDLQGDRFGDNALAAFEYAVVLSDPEWETTDCILLHTDQGSFGFPGDYELPVRTA